MRRCRLLLKKRCCVEGLLGARHQPIVPFTILGRGHSMIGGPAARRVTIAVRAALAVLLLVMLLAACTGRPRNRDSEARVELSSVCVVRQSEHKIESVPAALTGAIVQWPRGACIRLWDLVGQTPYSVNELTASFPEVPRIELRAFDRFAVTVCPGGKSTVAGLPGHSEQEAVRAGSLPKALLEACQKHAGKKLSARPSWGNKPGPPGLPGLSLSPPSAGNIKCDSGVTNPYAQADAGSYDNYNQPANKAKEDLTKEIGGWFGAGGVIGIFTGKGIPTGVGLGAGGKFLDLTVNTEVNAAKVGKYMWDQAIWAADRAAAAAAADAAGAQDAAAAAANIAKQNPGNPGVQKAANEAAAAAQQAQIAAQEAQRAANQTKAQFNGAGKNNKDAQKAAEEAKKARDEAEKKRKEAEDKAKEDKTKNTSAPPPKQGSPTQRPAPGSSDNIGGCEDLRMFVWQCEASGWQTFACQDFLWKLHGCAGDLTVIYPTDDGYKCASGKRQVDPATIKQIVGTMCGRLIHPVPDEDPCSPALEQLTGGIKKAGAGGCDPTIAFTEAGGCPVRPQVMIEVKVYCIPTPSTVPPIPCITVGNPPFPPAPTMQDALDGDIGTFIGSVDGRGTLSSRNAQLVSDRGGGYAVEYVFYGFNAVTP
jgi:hypothetical protein